MNAPPPWGFKRIQVGHKAYKWVIKHSQQCDSVISVARNRFVSITPTVSTYILQETKTQSNMYIDPGRSCRCHPHSAPRHTAGVRMWLKGTTEWVGGWGVCMSMWVGVGVTPTVWCEYEQVIGLGGTCAHARLKYFNSRPNHDLKCVRRLKRHVSEWLCTHSSLLEGNGLYKCLTHECLLTYCGRQNPNRTCDSTQVAVADVDGDTTTEWVGG